tara:strand:+ start:177 stop:317 length:141 start_codon:yes stop_codon:yes gene_type:complete
MLFKDLLTKLSSKQKQWLWFVALWLAGLLTVASIGYAIKFLMFIQL